MKIVITGASGFVGRNIIPLLTGRADLLLVGRDPSKLRSQYPEMKSCGYGDLATAARGWDVLLHLAVENNNSSRSLEEFRQSNVGLLSEVVDSAKAAGIRELLNVSSVHALDPTNLGNYAQSKREAIQALAKVEGISVRTIYLPAVYADAFSGKLAMLNKLPAPLRRLAFLALASLRPTVHVRALAENVLAAPFNSSTEESAILSDGQKSNWVYALVKRTIDLAASLFVIGALWWLFVLVWIAVKLTSSGPGVFAQVRVGQHGRQFVCFKFRTMKVGTPQAATNLIASSSVTQVGQFLRRTKLDELPQVWNILKNEMTLIGPRPCLPNQVELIEARRRRGVLALKPGISGLAQINGIDMSNPERLAIWDARYAALQSLLLDIKIALKTVLGKGQGDRVSCSAESNA